mmetsp:Transcript_20612/g.60884  ORF Transcript_20612/g.60884 Transcript_20612/m.60884 type:complete len:292 (-) Transcript_20612:63-938(-)
MVRLQRRLHPLRVRPRRAVLPRPRARVRDHHPLRRILRPRRRRGHLFAHARLGRGRSWQRRSRGPRLHHRGLRGHGPLGGHHHWLPRRLCLPWRLFAHAQAQDRRPPGRLRRAWGLRFLGRGGRGHLLPPRVLLQRERQPRFRLCGAAGPDGRAARDAHPRAPVGKHHLVSLVRRPQGGGRPARLRGSGGGGHGHLQARRRRLLHGQRRHHPHHHHQCGRLGQWQRRLIPPPTCQKAPRCRERASSALAAAGTETAAQLGMVQSATMRPRATATRLKEQAPVCTHTMPPNS